MRLSDVRREVGENLRLAWPLITAQIAAIGMGAIDTLYAGRLGAQALSAVAVAVNLFTLFLVFFMGLLMACSPIVAQLRGAERPAAELGQFLRHSRRFALVAGLVWVLVLNLVGPPALRALALPVATTEVSITFLRWFSASGVLTAVWFGLRFAAEGCGQVRPILIAGLCGLVANALLGWGLAFGAFGWHGMGINGLGLASTLATAVRVAVLEWHYRHIPMLRDALREARLHPPVKDASRRNEGGRSILRLGLPIATITTAEGGLFVMMAMLMARFGEQTVAAYQIALNVVSLVFMIPLGVGMATTVRVGTAVGAADFAEARRRGWIGIGLGGVNATSNAALMLLFAGPIARLYTRDETIARYAAHFLVLAAAFQVFDGLQGTTSGALRGFKDTRLPMLVTLCAYWVVGLPVGGVLAFLCGYGADGLWYGLSAGLAAAAAGLGWRYAQRSRVAVAA